MPIRENTKRILPHKTKEHDHSDTKKYIRTKKTKEPVIGIIGLGYVGLPLAIEASRRGYSVVGFDINEQLVKTLSRKHAPLFLNEEERKTLAKFPIHAETDSAVLQHADVVIICVPTPVTNDHQPDLRPLITACEALAPFLRKDMLVVVESTVNPGVCDEIILPILTRGSSLVPETDFLFAYCPERINPGDATWTVRTIPRVLGAIGPRSKQKAHALYKKLLDAPIHEMETIKEAEAVKITENSFRDINIAFVNELAMSFKKLDIDITHVLQGASTKPFGFMLHTPGCGVGGHCIPVDPYYLITYAKQNGFTHRFLETAREINNSMPVYTVDLLEQSLRSKQKDLPGARIALLGLSYKRNVPDLRESPALVIEQELSKRGAVVRTYDPYIPTHSSVYSLESALHNADGAIVATDHDVFTALTATDFALHNVDIVIDGRNCIDPQSFSNTTIIYQGIGR